MIYLDNAATTFQKPPEVSRAVYTAMRDYGANAGRGGHKLSAKAGEAVFEARELLCSFFGIEDETSLAFFPNTTYALNAAIWGIMSGGGHVITTSMEHNSVIRPLAEMQRNGKINFTVIKADKFGRISLSDLERAIRPNTRLIIMTGASNVCGNIYDIERAADIAHRNGAYILVDAAQIAGLVPINAQKFDMLAFPGHKGLMGPQGSGGLYVSPHIKLAPFISGGTGSLSESIYQPEEMPDRLESGTLNMPALAGLTEGVKFIMREGIENIHKREMELFNFSLNYLKNMENVVCYGDLEGSDRVGVLSFNIKGLDSVYVANELSDSFDIAVRGGLHCAAMAHRSLGTLSGGTVRLSFGYFNTKKEVKRAMEAIYRISKM